MLSIKKEAGIYRLQHIQTINCTISEAWDFFSRPENLNKMTPKSMPFEIMTSSLPAYTYQGQIISYQIQVLPLFKTNWVTEITLVDAGKLFIDEQRFGPYALWHHEHHFEAIGKDQVRMTDLISYKLPLGMLGRLVAGKAIESKLREIFEFRNEFCEQYFNK